MPELPEVETTARGVAPHVHGQVIKQVVIRQPVLRWPVPDTIRQTLPGLTIDSISRRGKYLLFNTAKGTMLVHLGMSGSLRILSITKQPEKHDHADFVLENELILRYNDPRRFGAILWTEAPASGHFLLQGLGVEPLSDDFNGGYLHQRAQNRLTPVKSFIMDSHIVVGVGNIYANEALFMAGIHPSRHAGRIALPRYQRLADCIKTVLQQAIAQGGTTLRNFVNESGKPGYFKQRLRAYGRGGEPCLNCLQPLKEIRINNRTTVFCPYCQK